MIKKIIGAALLLTVAGVVVAVASAIRADRERDAIIEEV